MDYIAILKETIKGARHAQYNRTVERANLYRQFYTGKNQNEIIVSYAPRESPQQKEQRIELYHTRTRDVCGRIESQFKKVRSVETADKIQTENGEQEKVLNAFASSFSGETLQKWLNNKTLYYNFTDPNAWQCLLYNSDGVLYPVIFSSENALNFKIINGAPLWFIGAQHSTQKVKKGIIKIADYLLLAAGIEIRAYSLNAGRLLPDGLKETSDDTVEINGIKYAIYAYEQPTTKTPATRFGYIPDIENAGETYAGVLDIAEFLFKDLINIKSEHDLTRALHTFPQKMQIAEACDHSTPAGDFCNGGRMSMSGHVCGACGGSGKKVISSVQDVMLVTPPTDKEAAETFVPLDKRVFYPGMPFEIVKNQKEDLKQIPRDISVAIFGVDVEERPNGATQTATAIDNYKDSINQVLSEYADRISQMWVFNILTAAQYLGISGVIASHRYPADFELMSAGDWLFIRDKAKTAGAGSDILAFLDAQVLKKLTNSDDDVVRRAEMINKIRPFAGTDSEVLKTHINLLPNNNIDKFLYLNIERVIDEVLSDDPDLLDKPFREIRSAVRTKTAEIIAAEEGSASFRENL